MTAKTYLQQLQKLDISINQKVWESHKLTIDLNKGSLSANSYHKLLHQKHLLENTDPNRKTLVDLMEIANKTSVYKVIIVDTDNNSTFIKKQKWYEKRHLLAFPLIFFFF